MPGVIIRGTGSYLPEAVLTNRDLSMMVDTSDEWIVTRTGIKERRIAPAGSAASDLGAAAARRACEAAGVEPGDLDLIVCATISGDQPYPSTACHIAARLGIPAIPAFDIQAACSGFLYALEVSRHLLKAGPYRRVLVVASECMSRLTDYTDRSSCVLLGDGAGAAVLERTETDGCGVLDCYLMADGRQAEILHLPAGGSRAQPSFETVERRLHFMRMEGGTLFRLAIEAMTEAGRILLERNGMTRDDLALVIPHQANMRIITAVARSLGVPMRKVFVNIAQYGNMSAACSAVALDEAVRSGAIAGGDLVLMVAFGAGLTWAGCLLRWQT